MLVLIWLISWLVLILTALILAAKGLTRVFCRRIIEWMQEGFRHALLDCGFRFPAPPQEPTLWCWVTCDDDATCPDCEERASWGPQPFRFWVETGLPGHLDAGTLCGPSCRCRLMPYYADQSAVFVNQKR